MARSLPSAPRRPGEKYARPDISLFTRRALALAAADARVPLDVAATLLCEASLLLERLDGRRVSHARELLDRAASSSRVTRALLGRQRRLPPRAQLPRAGAATGARSTSPNGFSSASATASTIFLHRSELLESSIRWEIGALLAERSMCSWGTEVVLGGFQSNR